MYIKQNLTIRTHTINHCKFIINHCKFITYTKNYFYNSTETMAKVGVISCVLIVFLVFYSGLFNLSALIEFHIVMIFLPSFQFVTFSCKYLLTKELIETILINSFSDPKKLNLLKTLGGCTGNTNSLHLIQVRKNTTIGIYLLPSNELWDLFIQIYGYTFLFDSIKIVVLYIIL